MSLTASELADHDLWATKQVEREAYLEAHPEDRRTDMISDESQKPNTSHASLPVGVVDQMAAERAAHLKAERDAIDSAEVVRAAGPELLSACRAQHEALDHLLALCVLEIPGFMPTQSAAWPAVQQGIAAIRKATGVSA